MYCWSSRTDQRPSESKFFKWTKCSHQTDCHIKKIKIKFLIWWFNTKALSARDEKVREKQRRPKGKPPCQPRGRSHSDGPGPSQTKQNDQALTIVVWEGSLTIIQSARNVLVHFYANLPRTGDKRDRQSSLTSGLDPVRVTRSFNFNKVSCKKSWAI